MVKVKNAIILAAGRGSRLKHLTKKIPKPLLKINKKNSFIEEIICNLEEKGIEDIIVVTGYKSRKFNFLKKRVTLIKNKEWNKGNNITSINAALDYFSDTLIINGDIVLNKNVIQKKYKCSLTYVEKNKNLNEWIVNVDDDFQIQNFDKKGIGKEGFYQREITFITKEISNLLKENIKTFDIKEYQEFLILKISKENKIPFKIYEIEPKILFDLDTVEEYEKFIKKNKS